MPVERETEVDTFNKVVREVAPRGVVTKGVTTELAEAYSGGQFKIVVAEGMPTWRLANWEVGNATLFLPQGISEEQVRAQIVDMLVDSFAIVRRLSGPRLKELKPIRESLKIEIFGGE